MQNIVDNTNNKKETTIERNDPQEAHYIHSASFKQNLKNRSKGEVIKMVIALYQQLEGTQEANKRLLAYTADALAVIVKNKIEFPTIEEYSAIINDGMTQEIKKNEKIIQ